MKLTWLLTLMLVGGCDAKTPAPRPVASMEASAAQQNPGPPVTNHSRPGALKAADADAGRYTSIDPARCRLIERNIEEGGYSRHACDGLGGYKLEISESDLRQDVVVIAPDGRQYLAVGTRVDLARWRITPAGLYCRTWNVADGGRERCHRVYRDGETFDFHVDDRWTVLRWARTRGRPADL